MLKTKVKSFIYECSCGYKKEIFIDYGNCEEKIICNNCGREIKVKEIKTAYKS